MLEHSGFCRTNGEVQMVADSIEISAKGKWVRVPAVNIAGKWITIKGTWLKIATIHDEWWLERELEDPEFCIRELKETRSLGLCPDMFTFTQKVPGSHPKFQYALEWESVAAARTSSFKNWWERLPQESRKNVRRSQKRGVLVRTQEFNDDLIRGIAGVNN